MTCARCGADLPDGARFCWNCGAAVAQGGPQAPVRKHVVILFCDIVGSTALGEGADPESLRARLAQYFDVVSQVIWQHGGTVEKFIGDAVMAVFGVPTSGEDDAERAVRAAIGIHEAVAALPHELHVRIGVNFGPVFVTHQPDGQFSVTGDAVNTAQRLEAAAQPDTTFVGDTVADLVGGSVALDDVGEIVHKGRVEPQQVYRVAADQSRQAQAAQSPFVGRSSELADLHAIADRSWRRRQGWLLTYVGEAGIGKSRMIREFAAARDDLRVIVVRADAMSTGAFALVAEMLADLAPDWERVAEQLLADAAPWAMSRLRAAAGVTQNQTSPDDVARAVGMLVERLCATQPVALVWDDLHHASSAQLELVRKIADACAQQPALTISLARPELFTANPTWGGGRNSRVEDVDPLDDAEIEAIVRARAELIVAHGGAAPAAAMVADPASVVDRADGNPQVAQLLVDGAASGREMPPTIAALYEAALDRLPADEREFVETAAVLGVEVETDAVADLLGAPVDDAMIGRLRARNVLVVHGADGLRFAQSVLQETAYESLPKRRRIELHEAYADRLGAEPATGAVERRAGHYRQAVRLARELDLTGDAIGALREKAATTALDTLRSLQLRGDPAVLGAVDRVFDVLLPGDQRHVELSLVLTVMRNSPSFSRRYWQDGLARIDAALADDPIWATMRRAPRGLVEIREGDLSLVDARAEAAAMVASLAALEAAGQDTAAGATGAAGSPPAQQDALPRGAWDMATLYLGQVDADSGNLASCHEICVEAIARAGSIGDVLSERIWRNFDLQIAYAGTAPMSEVVADCRVLQRSVAGHRGLWGTTTAVLAGALACMGEHDEAARQWRSLEQAYDGEAVSPYDQQHHSRVLLAAGEPGRASALWRQLIDSVDGRDRLGVSVAGSAAMDALFDGDIAAARAVVRRARAVELPEALGWLITDVTAFTAAVEHALRGDRAGALAQIELGSRVDRPQESPINAGFQQSIRAIVEHLLADDDAAAQAADRARAAFLSKEATALAAQVDLWLGNADKLRDSSQPSLEE